MTARNEMNRCSATAPSLRTQGAALPSPMGRGWREAPGEGACPTGESAAPHPHPLPMGEGAVRGALSQCFTAQTSVRTALGAGLLLLAVGAVALPALADDYDYEDRRDTINSSAGDANAANIATQTIDPWPPYAKNTNSHLDGQRAGVAITRYQQNKSIPPSGLNTTTLSQQAGPGAQASTSLQK
jgi:hypothetical protein